MTGKDILEYNKRVERGIKWLDKNIGPRKWRKKINLSKLDLSSSRTCVIGEVIGDYNDLYNEYGVSESEAKLLGFQTMDTSAGSLHSNERTKEYNLLTAVWIGALKCMKIGIKK